MKTLFAALALSLLVSVGAFAQDEKAKPARIDAKDEKALRAAIGKRATVIGKIDRTKDWGGGANFLDFAGKKFSLVCFEPNYEKFVDEKGKPSKPAFLYKDKDVEVTGTIGEHKGKLQIKLTSPGQIKVLDAKEVAEKKAATSEKTEKSDGDKKKVAPTGKKDKALVKKVDSTRKDTKKVDPKKYFCG